MHTLQVSEKLKILIEQSASQHGQDIETFLTQVISTYQSARINSTDISSILEQIPYGVMISDTQGSVKYINQRFIDETGYDEQHVLGQMLSFRQTEDTPREVYMSMVQEIQAGKAWQGDLVLVKNIGQEHLCFRCLATRGKLLNL